jgi:hypothetical protein
LLCHFRIKFETKKKKFETLIEFETEKYKGDTNCITFFIALVLSHRINNA